MRQLPGQIELIAGADPLAAADALCYVIHLLGDLHQPLHCAALADGEYFTTPPEYDQGGNLIRWGKDVARGSNLHALWDDSISSSTGDVEARVQATLGDYPQSHFSAAQLALGLEDIAYETFDIAKTAYDDFLSDTTYQGPSQTAQGGQQFSSPSPKYRSNARTICRERAALAAYRLARIIKEQLAGSVSSLRSTGTGRKKPAKKAAKKVVKKVAKKAAPAASKKKAKAARRR